MHINIDFLPQAYSGLGADGVLSGSVMDLPTVFTDHSLFGFADVSSILTNKLFEFFSSDIDHMICVSYTRYIIETDQIHSHDNLLHLCK